MKLAYDNFNVKDFVLDESFQAWVLEPGSAAHTFWPEWLQQHPEKQAAVNKARAIILELYGIGLRQEQTAAEPAPTLLTEASPAEMAAVWQNISATLRLAPPALNEETVPAAAGVISIFSFGNWVKIAAAVTLLIGVGYLFWLRQAPAQKPTVLVYATNFGETKQLTLPDQSVVYLNANSQLTVPARWATTEDRTVELTGEAFFAIRPTENQQKFQVNIAAGAQVEVLGTEFTVTNRPDLARVVLNQGKVKVGLPNLQKSLSGAAVVMAPGDLVQINQQTHQLSKQKVTRPEKYAAFTQNLLEFNDAPLAEVARVLRDTYGYQVSFAPQALATKRLTSSGPGNRVDLLLFIIEKTFNLKVVRKGRRILIQAK